MKFEFYKAKLILSTTPFVFEIKTSLRFPKQNQSKRFGQKLLISYLSGKHSKMLIIKSSSLIGFKIFFPIKNCISIAALEDITKSVQPVA